MLKKGTKIYSILTGTCPRCQSRNMYVNKNPFNITQTMQMHDHCSKCGLKYKIEPNFFFGAMYVSYALAVAFGLFIFALSFFLFKLTILESFLSIFFGLIIIMPWVARLARNIYINLFISYNPNEQTSQQND